MSGGSPKRSLDEPCIGIAGVGLIGGSIAAALKSRGFAGRIVGHGRNRDRIESAKAAGIIDDAVTDYRELAEHASLIVFCTPVDRIPDGIAASAPHAKPDTILTDAGSVKGSICRALTEPLPDGVSFIGSHPIAGSEKQGFENADPNLFDGRVCVVTPVNSTPGNVTDRVDRFWTFLGMSILQMSVEQHDEILARTSHLPHVVASALASLISDDMSRQCVGTGFSDTTRVAAGGEDLWAAILSSNADAVADALGEMSDVLIRFQSAIRERDADSLRSLLAAGRTARESL